MTYVNSLRIFFQGHLEEVQIRIVLNIFFEGALVAQTWILKDIFSGISKPLTCVF